MLNYNETRLRTMYKSSLDVVLTAESLMQFDC